MVTWLIVLLIVPGISTGDKFNSIPLRASTALSSDLEFPSTYLD